MRISQSENYQYHRPCRLLTCDRQYCKDHRMLWRDCDTAIRTHDGTGELQWELRACPHCEKESRDKYTEEEIMRWKEESYHGR